jgi:hypothetical protein
VRKIVRLSREKAVRIEPLVLGNSNQDSNASVVSTSCSTSHDQTPKFTISDSTTVDFLGPTGTVADVVPLAVLPPVMSGPTGQVCMKLEEDAMEEEDKKFVDDVLALMRREMTFAGQIRLMESVLRINNDVVLNWYEVWITCLYFIGYQFWHSFVVTFAPE